MRWPSNLAKAFSSGVRSLFFINSFKILSKRLFSRSFSITVGAAFANNPPYLLMSNLALTVLFPLVSIIFRVRQNCFNIDLFQIVIDDRNQSILVARYIEDRTISVDVCRSKSLFYIVKISPYRLKSGFIPSVK